MRSAAGRIVCVDDSPEYGALLRAAAQTIEPRVELAVLDSFQSACDFICRLVPGSPEIPALLLLDQNLGEHLGTELLTLLRAKPELGHIHVAILTNSVAAYDIFTCYQQGADYYLIKPAGLARTKGLLCALQRCLDHDPTAYSLLKKLPEYHPPPA